MKPVIIRGIEYPSHKAAADALWVCKQTISAAVKVGTENHIGMGKGRFCRPVSIRGVHYASSVEAAKAMGVDPNVVRIAARKGTLDNVGLGPLRRSVSVDGVLYGSHLDASKEIGCNQSTLSVMKHRAVKRGDVQVLVKGRVVSW